MAIDSEHTNIILQRVFDDQDDDEKIVLISGEDKRRISIHRVILKVSSKFFTRLFDPSSRKEKPKEFVLDDSDGGTIKTVVNFCYTGIINLTDENVEKCLAIASSTEIDLLVNKCRLFYAAKLDVANAVNTLIIADKYRLGDLRERASLLVGMQFQAVPSTDIQKMNHELLHELLEYEKIQEYGDLCARRLLDWFQHDEDERGVYMPELLQSIQLNQLTLEFLNDTLEPIFERFYQSDRVNVEYQRRGLNQRVGNTVPLGRSIYNVVLQDVPMDESEYYTSVRVERYNDSSNCFDTVLDVIVEILTGQPKFHRVIMHKNKIFVLGSKSVYSFDLSSGKETVLPEMNVARANFTSILVGNYIYVFGGRIESGALRACERFDIEKNTWQNIASMDYAREYASAVVLNGYIYIAGNFKNVGSLVEMYDPENDEWTQVPPMNNGRVFPVLVETHGFLYAMGSSKVIEKFDPYKRCWTEVGSFDDSGLITSSITIGGEIFAIMRNGKFGRVEIHSEGKCSFVPLCESIRDTDNMWTYSLFHI